MCSTLSVSREALFVLLSLCLSYRNGETCLPKFTVYWVGILYVPKFNGVPGGNQ